MARSRLGEQLACECCGADIEFHGKPYRRELAPGIFMTDGGWVDRGSGRFCLPWLDRRTGETVDPGRRLHQPYRP